MMHNNDLMHCSNPTILRVTVIFNLLREMYLVRIKSSWCPYRTRKPHLIFYSQGAVMVL